VGIPRGQEPRQNPCDGTFGAHIDDATDDFLREAVRQRRERVRADISAFNADLAYLNERRAAAGKPLIQMYLNDPSPSPPRDG
jgi:hypothetical protein